MASAALFDRQPSEDNPPSGSFDCGRSRKRDVPAGDIVIENSEPNFRFGSILLKNSEKSVPQKFVQMPL
jgi:hypothetical protein